MPKQRAGFLLRAAIWLGAWAALSGLGAALNIAVWSPAVVEAGASDHLKPVANVFQFLAVPGWIVLRPVTPIWRPTGAGANIAAHSAAWAFWLGALYLASMVRARLLRPESQPVGPAPSLLLSRRRFLLDAPIALGSLGAGAGLARATLLDPWDLQVRSYTVPVRGLPRSLDGLRLAHLTDLHLGPRVPALFLEQAVDRAIALRPDLMLLTGDYIHTGRGNMQAAARLFDPVVRSQIPVVGVLGNHDWYGGGPEMAEALVRAGVVMIDNARVFFDAAERRLTDTPPREALCLAGVGDLLEDTVDVDAALSGVPESAPRLMLAHNPDTAELPAIAAARPRIDLMVSGHTHGGQVSLPFIGAPIVPSDHGQKYAGGLVKGPACPVLVSRGLGMSILPIRFRVPPEIVLLTLTRAEPL